MLLLEKLFISSYVRMFWWLPCPDTQSRLELSFAGHFHIWFTVGAEWASQQNV